MLDPINLGKEAAEENKLSRIKTQRARAGRNAKGDSIPKQLHAAGEPKMNTGSVIGYPRGRGIK